MSKDNRIYLCIDLKSFYASVECVERGLNPITTKLVVADPDRTEKTITLAATPAMKALGVKSRGRVFEIPKDIDYIMAKPRMSLYIKYSADIYAVYLKYISKNDMFPYSIDEVFMDVTDYLSMYNMTAKELGIRIMDDVYKETGITATCGIGTNLYLAKIALDITAKHVEDHIGILDEKSYRETLWNHRPLTDFWRIGPGIAGRLSRYGIHTMGDIAKTNEDFLYKLIGVDAELLIDHAWGREIVTMEDIKNYKPKHNSLTRGQVLACDYRFAEGKLVVKEMADLLCLDLIDKGLITPSATVVIGYSNSYGGHANGTAAFKSATNSAKEIVTEIEKLYDKIVDRDAPIKRINMTFNNVIDEANQQYDIFTDPAELEKERNMQKAMLAIKKKYGKNAILKGMDLSYGATTRERNSQIGGHNSDG